MEALFSSLGVDWRLFLSQATNFLILLGIISFLVWKPLKAVLEERREKIELGVRLGEEAEQKMGEIEVIKKEAIARSEREAGDLLKLAEIKGKKKSENIILDAHKRGDIIIAEAEIVASHEKEAALKDLEREAGNIIKIALAKAINAYPDEIDAKLINEAAGIVAKEIG